MKKSDASRWHTTRAMLFIATLAATLAAASLGQMARAQVLDQSRMIPSDRALLQDYEAYDSNCRGNSGDDPDTWVACGARDYIGYLLGLSGYCYSQSDRAEDDWEWHICTSKSNRLEKP